ncbi:HAMP domain-containing sensor histidine kinase [Pedobacter sp. R20-19]|uniref:sensor histidine kinase n=1 Tax=Pedobacter sp. R20-19 TaxID=1270196 RepID=UPI00049352C9|nr:HAMP domain-containing sensor histidine kinase [Pedobacter sp. R20-19]
MYSAKISASHIPVNEELRLEKLKEYEILDTPAEKSFDHFVQLAADIFEMQNAILGFFAEDGFFIKAAIGNPLDSNGNQHLFDLLKEADDADVIEIAQQFANISESPIPFIIAAGIKSADGVHLGALVVYGDDPHTTIPSQLSMLNRLAEMIADKLEVRKALRKTLKAQDDRLHVLIHDLKNPMTTISLQSELVGRIPNADDRTVSIAGKINHQSKRMVDHLNQILSSARKENGSFKPQKNKIDLRELLSKSIKDLQIITRDKRQFFNIRIDTPVEIFGDEVKLSELFYQLLHNASKFSHADSEILITHQITENLVTIAIKDHGVGLSADDLNLLFIKFSRLSSTPTNHENSNGLGLIVARMFTDMHKGKLWAESEGKGKGTTFFIALPIK